MMMESTFFQGEGDRARSGHGPVRMDPARMPSAIALLAKELLEIEAGRDRVRARELVQEVWRDASGAENFSAKRQDVPVDVDPVFSFSELPPRPARAPQDSGGPDALVAFFRTDCSVIRKL